LWPREKEALEKVADPIPAEIRENLTENIFEIKKKITNNWKIGEFIRQSEFTKFQKHKQDQK
jgi:hypothetical protein